MKRETDKTYRGKGWSSVLIHVLHIHDCCCVCIPTLSAIFALVLLYTVYVHECILSSILSSVLHVNTMLY